MTVLEEKGQGVGPEIGLDSLYFAGHEIHTTGDSIYGTSAILDVSVLQGFIEPPELPSFDTP